MDECYCGRCDYCRACIEDCDNRWDFNNECQCGCCTYCLTFIEDYLTDEVIND